MRISDWSSDVCSSDLLDVRDGIGATLSHLQEGIAGVRVVQAFGREDIEASRFATRRRSLYDAHMRSVKVSAWYMPIIELGGLLTTAVAVGVGGWWVHQGELTTGPDRKSSRLNSSH